MPFVEMTSGNGQGGGWAKNVNIRREKRRQTGFRQLSVTAAELSENFKKQGFDSQLQGTAHHDGEGLAAGAGGSWSHCVYNEEAERGECWPSAHSFVQSQMPVHWMVLPTIRVDCPTSVDSRNSL